MDTSESIELKFKPVASDRLFYDRWNYCIKVHLREISAMRGIPSTEQIDKLLTDRERWRQQVRFRWPSTKIIHGDDVISDQIREHVKLFAEFLRAQTDYKITITVNFAWIYTNDIQLIQQINSLPYLRICGLTQVKINRPKNVIVLKNSEHTHRSYFRSCKLDSDQREQLYNFLHSQPNIRISPALTEWLESNWTRTQDYFFVDHIDEKWTLMLSLVCPRIIRKTLPIITK